MTLEELYALRSWQARMATVGARVYDMGISMRDSSAATRRLNRILKRSHRKNV